MATLAEQAAAFRNATDRQYADLINGRISAADIVTANTRKRVTMANLIPGDRVILSFDGEYEEPATFVGNVEENGEPLKRFESVEAGSGGRTYTWEAYRYSGRWVYGSSAQRLTVSGVQS